MISYREMIALDIPVLVGMEKEIYPESPWSAAQFREELAGVPSSRKYLVATEDNEIIGYGGIALAGDVADIHTLTVIPSYRRRGTATTRHRGDQVNRYQSDHKASSRPWGNEGRNLLGQESQSRGDGDCRSKFIANGRFKTF